MPPGAYALVVALTRPFAPPIRGLARRRLAAERYLYGGAANGPGGIRARVRRHVKREKPVHWHIDWLTNAFGVAAARPAGGRRVRRAGGDTAVPGRRHPDSRFRQLRLRPLSGPSGVSTRKPGYRLGSRCPGHGLGCLRRCSVAAAGLLLGLAPGGVTAEGEGRFRGGKE